MNEVLDKFLTYLKEVKGYSPLTLRSYQIDISDFFVFLENANRSYDEADKSVARSYLLSLSKRNYEASTLQRKLSSLRCFYRYLALYEGVEQNPFASIKGPKRSKKLPEFFHHEEIEEFLEKNSCRTDKLQSRDQAILELLYASGLRASELVLLKVDDLSFSSQSIRFVGKGNKERVTFFTKRAKEALEDYIHGLRIVLSKGKEEEILFLSSRGNPLTVRGL